MYTVKSTKLRLILNMAFVLVFAIGFTFPVQAKAESPKILLEETAHQMIDAINNNRDKIKVDPNVTTQLIEEILIPHLDFITASKYVLGNNWDEATKAQKIAFIKAFRTLLLRFYSSALTEYLNSHDERLEVSLMSFFEPGEAQNGQLTVRSMVSPKTGKPVPINYQMRKTKRGWKIFDVSVEGVSVITTYKTSFASEIKQSGLDALITSVEKRNAKLLAGDTSVLKTDKKQ